MAEEYLNSIFEDKIKIIEKIIKTGYVDFNWNNYNDDNNFYVKNPAGVLELLTGKKWSVTKELPSYKKEKREYLIEYWYKAPYGHFARTKKSFNSLQTSNCVKNGVLHSYRVARVL